MPTNDYMFEYVKQRYTQIAERLLNTDIIYISGEARIGKTYLAQSCMGKVKNTDYCKMYLKAYDNYKPSYHPFYFGLSKEDAFLEASSVALSEFCNNSDDSRIKLVTDIISYRNNYREKKFFHLNNTEISIINRISYKCRKRSLFLVVDDYEKWDEDSKKLLHFFLTKEARENIPFLKKSKILIVSNSEKYINAIEEFCLKMYSVKLLGHNTHDEFATEIKKIRGGFSESLTKSLFDISKGNVGIIHDIITYIGNCYSEADWESVQKEHECKKLFLSIINHRTKSLESEQQNFIQTLKIASVMGEIFNHIYLPEIIGENEFTIDKILSIAQKEKYLHVNDNFIYSFFNTLVYQYFDENFNENKKEYHFKFAQSIKKLRPDDYYIQFFHLNAAGKKFEAMEALTIYLIRRELSGYEVDEQLYGYLKNEYYSFYENYQNIQQAICYFKQRHYDKALQYLEIIIPISEEIFQETEYLKALFVYDSGMSGEFQDICDLLSDKLDTLLDKNFDIWLRCALLLYVFYVNRLSDSKQAKKIERWIIKEIAKRFKDNPTLETVRQILNRNSGAIYSIEIALHKTEKSVLYFENKIKEDPILYITALTNYSGLLITMSQYEMAYSYAQIGIDLLQEKRIYMNDVEKVINNFVISGVLSKKMAEKNALKIYDQIISDDGNSPNVLLLSNYYILQALAKCDEEAFQKFYQLFESDIVQKHNDYYIYLIGINLICVSIPTHHYLIAQQIFERLDHMVPAICEGEKNYIERRYKVFSKVIASADTAINSIDSLFLIFLEQMEDIPYDYVKRPYIFTDQQFWSLI